MIHLNSWESLYIPSSLWGPYTNIPADKPVDNIYFIQYGYNQDFNIFLLGLSHLLHTYCCPQVILRECLWGGGVSKGAGRWVWGECRKEQVGGRRREAAWKEKENCDPHTSGSIGVWAQRVCGSTVVFTIIFTIITKNPTISAEFFVKNSFFTDLRPQTETISSVLGLFRKKYTWVIRS
jgi:hypothetical protein